jgi:iron(III) transport system substrate-binding protein
MSRNLTTSFLMAGLFAGAVAAAPQAAFAADLSAVEQLYADLAKMPAADRSKKIMEGAKKEGKIEMISANYGTEWRPREILWEKLFPDIKVNSSGVASSAVAERFIAEETAGRHLTDAIELSSADMPKIIELKLTASFTTPVTDKILPKYRGFLTLFPENRWMPTSMTEHGVVYNFKELSEADRPKDWFDLCKPVANGKSSYDAVEARLLIGWYTMLGEQKATDLIKCIGANKPILQTGHSDRLALMEAGDHPISGDILIYGVERFAKEQPAKNVLKVAYETPVLADAFGASINRNAPHPYAAALYLDWLHSDDNQLYLQQRMRGPLGVKHPFMPDDAQIVTFGPIDQKIVDRLMATWMEFVAKKDARKG